jgi:hypothetical protein
MIKTKTSLVALASLLVLDLAMPIAAQDSFARTDRLAAQVAAAPVMVRQQQQQQQQQRGGQAARDQDAQQQKKRRERDSSREPVEKDW